MKSPLGFLVLFWFMAFIFSVVGLTVYIRGNDRRIAFRKTTNALQKNASKAKGAVNIHSLILIVWWLAWFFAITGGIGFLSIFLFDIDAQDLKDL